MPYQTTFPLFEKILKRIDALEISWKKCMNIFYNESARAINICLCIYFLL